MKYRKKLSKGHSRKLFTKTADNQHVHPKNAHYVSGPMRGGIRL